MLFERMTAAEFRCRLASGEFDKPTAKSGRSIDAHHRPKRNSQQNPPLQGTTKNTYGLEETLHRACFDWIFAHENRYPILKYTFHAPNGGRRSKGEAGRFKAMGVRKGVVDIINPFASDYAAGLACELKAPNGRITEEQQQFLETARQNNYVTGVCYSIDDFIKCVHKYIGA